MAKVINIPGKTEKNIVFGVVKSTREVNPRGKRALTVTLPGYYDRESRTLLDIEITLWDEIAKYAKSAMREGVAFCFECGGITVVPLGDKKIARTSANHYHTTYRLEFEKNGRKQNVVVGPVYRIQERGELLTMGVRLPKYNRVLDNYDTVWFNAVAGNKFNDTKDKMMRLGITDGTTMMLLTGEESSRNGYKSAFIFEFEIGVRKNKSDSSGSAASNPEESSSEEDEGSTFSDAYLDTSADTQEEF